MKTKKQRDEEVEAFMRIFSLKNVEQKKVELQKLDENYKFLITKISELEEKEKDLTEKVDEIVNDIKLISNIGIIKHSGLIDFVINTSCEIFGVREEVLKSKYRGHEVVNARKFIYKMLRDHTNMGLDAIGIELGGKNHATILHGLKTHELDYKQIPSYNRRFNAGKILVDKYLKQQEQI